MDFALTGEQRMLQREVRGVLDAHCSPGAVRGWLRDGVARPPDLWRRIADLGWLGFALPPEHGGLGAGFVDLVLLHEVCGGALMPTLFRTSTWATLTLLASTDAADVGRYLPDIARGAQTATLALSEARAIHDMDRIETAVTERAGGMVLSGTKCFVENGAHADWLVVSARRALDGVAPAVLVVVPRAAPGVHVVPAPSFAGDPQADVVFEDVVVESRAVLDAAGLPAAMDRMTTLLCADMVGGFGRVVELTIAYVKERRQFGRAIGSFQAVQHVLADMAAALEGARWATYQAAWRLERGYPAAKEIAVAQAWTAPAYKAATLTAHQLHGGTGFVTEYDLYLYSNRAKAYESRLGGVDRHLERIARELDL
jgi:alkylation response protein AidB-like acyl-CoA dehydrogenase